MCAFRALHIVRFCLPGERLAHTWTDTRDGDAALFFEYRAGYTHPALVRELGQLARGIAESGVFDFDPAGGGEPCLDVWYERVPGEYLGDRILVPRIGSGSRLFIELKCHADLVEPEVIRELNEEVMPSALTGIVPAMQQTT
jgi:hypothetical protein